VETQGKKRHRATHQVIAGVVDELVIQADMNAVGDHIFIGFENAFPGVGQGTVAEDDVVDASGGEIIRMRVRNSIEHTADTDLVFCSSPEIAADMDATRGRPFDSCKIKDSILSRGHAEPREESKARGDLPFEIKTAAHLDAPCAHVVMSGVVPVAKPSATACSKLPINPSFA
jgi:hypothetical protein